MAISRTPLILIADDDHSHRLMLVTIFDARNASLAGMEKEIILRKLQEAGSNKSEAARRRGITRGLRTEALEVPG